MSNVFKINLSWNHLMSGIYLASNGLSISTPITRIVVVREEWANFINGRIISCHIQWKHSAVIATLINFISVTDVEFARISTLTSSSLFLCFYIFSSLTQSLQEYPHWRVLAYFCFLYTFFITDGRVCKNIHTGKI